MKHIYYSALAINDKRIKQCGNALKSQDDPYSVAYWNMELAKAQFLKFKILKRLKLNHNIIKVDFTTKKRAA